MGRRIRRERPDFVLMKYWTPFMAPCFGTIARIARGNGHTKVLCQIDNVEPHERHLTDKPFNRYYLRAVDGFVYMSEQVHRELEAYSKAPALFSPHPLFENFGERVARSEACVRLGLDPAVALRAVFRPDPRLQGARSAARCVGASSDARGATEGRRLIVAGEFYTPKERYLQSDRRQRFAGRGDASRPLSFPTTHVKYYFSAADFVVQPYKTATQSGVTQIAYQFCVPMVVTDGRGAGRDRARRTGGVCLRTDGRRASPKPLRTDVRRVTRIERFRLNCVEERQRFSWEEMCSRITELYERVR